MALAALAAPALASGSAPRRSSAPTGTSARSFNDTMAGAFGKGFDAQVLLVAQTPDAQARTAWTALARELPAGAGRRFSRHARAAPEQLSTIQVVPPPRPPRTRRPATSSHTLRSGVIPRAEAGTDLHVYVGGTTATNIDSPTR